MATGFISSMVGVLGLLLAGVWLTRQIVDLLGPLLPALVVFVGLVLVLLLLVRLRRWYLRVF